jgi:pimeloyl-ACP methyl ester carboxylesterase
MASYSDEYFTNSDGLSLHYRDYNIAPAGSPIVLCLPGLTRNAKDFGIIADHLAPKCRVICAEQRGRGLSEWDPEPKRYAPITYVGDMMELLALLKLKSVITLGTSLGGIMTMLMNAMHPGTVKAAIINDIGPEIDPKGVERIKSYVGKGTPPQTWEQAITAVKSANSGVYPHFKEQDWERFTHHLYADKAGKPVVQYDPAINQNFNKEENQSAPDLWPAFSQMHSVPMVVLRGELSDILSAETLERMAYEHPDLKAVTVPGVGHVPLMDEPLTQTAIDQLIRRFL